MFLANMAEAERMEESAEDITAADTAPSPKKEMTGGQRNCRHMGRIRFSRSSGMGSSPSYSVAFQSFAQGMKRFNY